jgi:Zn-dependent protease with chaperone function
MALPPPGQGEHGDTPEARAYNRIRRRLTYADLAISFLFLVALLIFHWSQRLRDISYRSAHQRYALAVLLFVLFLSLAAKLLGMGLDFYGFRVEHRFHLSNQKFGGWVWDEIKEWLVGFVLMAILVELLYWFIRVSPQYWWLITWAIFNVLSIFFAQIAPIVFFPIFYKYKPLEREELKARLLKLSERAGTRVRGVYEWKLSEKSKKANAALMGIGHTRRIVVADTLLNGYSDDEIEAVLAHELGHHVHHHIFKSIFVQVGLTLLGFWVANWVLNYSIDMLRMFDGLADFANLPLLALVSSVLSLLLLPLMNAYSRYNERQADRYCFRSVTSVEPFITAMNKLGDQNLAEREPSRVVEVLFHSHPPIPKRIRAAEQWQTANRAVPRKA